MIIGEIKKGTTIKCWFEAIKSDFSAEELTSIDNLIVKYSQNGGTPATMTGATCTLNADMGQWLLEAPASFIPSYGVIDIVVKGTNIEDVKIRLAVLGGGGMGQVIPYEQYNISTSAKTITLDDSSITISQIQEIYNVSQQCYMYRPKNARSYIDVADPDYNTKLDIKMDTPGVITYAATPTSITNDDILIIQYAV
jgi:hypothetical protein